MTHNRKPALRGQSGLSNSVIQLGGGSNKDRQNFSTDQRFSDYPNVPGYKGDLDTGRLGAKLIGRRSGSIRHRALTALAYGPATAEQIAVVIDEHFMIVRARMSEARALGLVDDSGQRGQGALGGKVVVWRLTSELERAQHAARKALEADQ